MHDQSVNNDPAPWLAPDLPARANAELHPPGEGGREDAVVPHLEPEGGLSSADAVLLWAELRAGPLTADAVSVAADRVGLSGPGLAAAVEALVKAKLIPHEGFTQLIDGR